MSYLMSPHLDYFASRNAASVQAAQMTEAWVREEHSDREESFLLLEDQLDMRDVANILHYRSLQLQTKRRNMAAMPLGQANAIWPLKKLQDITGHAGTNADPFVVSGESLETGVLFMASSQLLRIHALRGVP